MQPGRGTAAVTVPGHGPTVTGSLGTVTGGRARRRAGRAPVPYRTGYAQRLA